MPTIKLDKKDLRIIKSMIESKQFTDKEIALKFNVSRGHICKIKNGKRWNYEY
jgi:predicted XRE-type DNA-binding protein